MCDYLLLFDDLHHDRNDFSREILIYWWSSSVINWHDCFKLLTHFTHRKHVSERGKRSLLFLIDYQLGFLLQFQCWMFIEWISSNWHLYAFRLSQNHFKNAHKTVDLANRPNEQQQQKKTIRKARVKREINAKQWSLIGAKHSLMIIMVKRKKSRNEGVRCNTVVVSNKSVREREIIQ